MFSIQTLKSKSKVMSESVYKIIELVGSSPESWEKAAQNAITRASESLARFTNCRSSPDGHAIHEGKIKYYRTKLKFLLNMRKLTELKF